MGKYSTRPKNKVWAFSENLIHWTCFMCCIFPYRTKNVQRLYFLTQSSHIWHTRHILQFKLQLECDMGWYRYTYHIENRCTECEKYSYLAAFVIILQDHSKLNHKWKNNSIQWFYILRTVSYLIITVKNVLFELRTLMYIDLKNTQNINNYDD